MDKKKGSTSDGNGTFFPNYKNLLNAIKYFQNR